MTYSFHTLVNFDFNYLTPALLSLIPALGTILIFFYVVITVPLSRDVRVFLSFMVSCGIWQLAEGFMRLSASPATAEYYSQFVEIGFMLTIATGLHFAVRFTEFKEWPDKWWFWLVSYVPMTFFVACFQFRLAKFTIARSYTWNWISVRSGQDIENLQVIWIGLIVSATAMLYILYTIKARQKAKIVYYKSLIICIGYFIPALTGIVTQIIFPFVLGIPEFPMTTASICVYILFVAIAHKKLQLFTFDDRQIYQHIINGMNDAIVLTDLQNIIHFSNAKLSELTGYSHSELVGMNIEKLLWDHREIQKLHSKAQLRLNKVSDQYGLCIKTKNNVQRHLLVGGSPYVDRNGNATGSIAIMLDVSEKKRQEERTGIAFEIAKKANRVILDLTDIARFILKQISNQIEVSYLSLSVYDRTCNKLNYPYMWMNGKEFVDSVEDRQANLNWFVITTGKKYYLNAKDRAKLLAREKLKTKVPTDGSTYLLPLRHLGQIVGVFTIHTNNKVGFIAHELELFDFIGLQIAATIEKQQVLNELEISHNKYKDLYNNAPDMYLYVDLKTLNILDCNRTLESVTGHIGAEIIGKSIEELLIIPDDVSFDTHTVIQESTITSVILKINSKRKKQLIVSQRTTYEFGKDKKTIAARVVWRDITHENKIEEELKFADFILKNIGSYVIAIDQYGDMVYANHAVYDDFNLTEEQIINGDWFSRIVSEKFSYERFANYLKSVAKKRIRSLGSFELCILDNNKHEHYVLFKESRVEGGVLLILGQDITDRKQSLIVLIEARRKSLQYQSMLLGSQLSPHFIFNSLNSVQFYIMDNNPEPALNYISEFAILMRLVLENAMHEFISIETEITFLKHFLSLEQRRFSNKFDYEINVDDNIDIYEWEISPMLLQPYVENTVVHGLSNKKGEGHLIINFSVVKNKLKIIIEDNGIGRKKAEVLKQLKAGHHHKSISTEIVSKRLDILNELFENQYKLKIIDILDDKGVGCGTRIEIIIPSQIDDQW